MTAGTILHGSKLALTIWFWAASMMATHSNGLSAVQFAEVTLLRMTMFNVRPVYGCSLISIPWTNGASAV